MIGEFGDIVAGGAFDGGIYARNVAGLGDDKNQIRNGVDDEVVVAQVVVEGLVFPTPLEILSFELLVGCGEFLDSGLEQSVGFEQGFSGETASAEVVADEPSDAEKNEQIETGSDVKCGSGGLIMTER